MGLSPRDVKGDDARSCNSRRHSEAANKPQPRKNRCDGGPQESAKPRSSSVSLDRASGALPPRADSRRPVLKLLQQGLAIGSTELGESGGDPRQLKPSLDLDRHVLGRSHVLAVHRANRRPCRRSHLINEGSPNDDVAPSSEVRF